MTETVTVYRFTYWDENAGAHVTSSRYATLETIRSGLGNAVPESALKVRRSDLTDGLYLPSDTSRRDTHSA